MVTMFTNCSKGKIIPNSKSTSSLQGYVIIPLIMSTTTLKSCTVGGKRNGLNHNTESNGPQVRLSRAVKTALIAEWFQTWPGPTQKMGGEVYGTYVSHVTHHIAIDDRHNNYNMDRVVKFISL